MLKEQSLSNNIGEINQQFMKFLSRNTDFYRTSTLVRYVTKLNKACLIIKLIWKSTLKKFAEQLKVA